MDKAMAAKTTITGKGGIFLVWLTVAAFTSTAWAGTYSGGTGTAEDPYLISTAEDMNAIGAEPNDWDAHFLLVNDIDLSAYTGRQFNIIGNHSNPFTGVFDGNDHTISSFTYGTNNTWYIGLFGYIYGANAVIKDLTLVTPDVNAAGDSDNVGCLVGRLVSGTITGCAIEGGSVSGKDWWTGGLVGYNSGTISNCYSSVSVSGGGMYTGGLVGGNYGPGTISNCYAEGSVSGNYDTGGLVGLNAGQITCCRSDADVSGSDEIGGLVGENKGTILKCSSSASVSVLYTIGSRLYAGGLVGQNWWGRIIHSYSTAATTGHLYVGGLVGENYFGDIGCCYATGNVSGYWHVGGLVGYNWHGDISNSYSINDVSGNRNVGGLVGLNSSEYPRISYISNCYSASGVYGQYNVGAFTGIDTSGLYQSSFWDSDVNPDVNGIGNTDDPNVTDKTTAEMKTESTFTDAGWDFIDETTNGIEDIWRLCEDGTDYPKLSWQFLLGDFLCPDGVNSADYSFFAEHWLDNNCAGSNNCDHTDLDLSGTVNINDLKIFADNWLQGVGQ